MASFSLSKAVESDLRGLLFDMEFVGRDDAGRGAFQVLLPRPTSAQASDLTERRLKRLIAVLQPHGYQLDHSGGFNTLPWAVFVPVTNARGTMTNIADGSTQHVWSARRTPRGWSALSTRQPRRMFADTYWRFKAEEKRAGKADVGLLFYLVALVLFGFALGVHLGPVLFPR